MTARKSNPVGLKLRGACLVSVVLFVLLCGFLGLVSEIALVAIGV